MRTLQLDRRAKAELRKAIRDYTDRDPELAQEFIHEYLERVRFIVRSPEAGQRIAKHKTILVQRYLMKKRFPFKLITATKGDRMKILAIAHHSQAPDYWEDRLEDEKKAKTKGTKKRKKK